MPTRDTPHEAVAKLEPWLASASGRAEKERYSEGTHPIDCGGTASTRKHPQQTSRFTRWNSQRAICRRGSG